MPQRHRIGSVGYLNALPLIEGLEHDVSLEIATDSPARIADALARGDLDLGLVPVVEAARQRLWAVPGPAVAARGPVISVLLVSRAPLAAIRRLALDPASRTSVVLARLLLASVHGIRPEILVAPEEGDPLASGADAAVVIGDRALAGEFSGLEVIDLARWWIEWTGLPFVFALWAGRDREVVAGLKPVLERARARGLEAIDAIAEREAPPRGIDTKFASEYLRNSIHYDAGAPERQGLELFLGRSRTAALLPPAAEIRFA